METKFKKGDVVRLKSGGPKMTISTIHTENHNFMTGEKTGNKEEPEYFVEWFDEKNLLKNATFKESVIEID